MIKPSMREKKRYIRFEILSKEKVYKEEIEDTIYQEALRLFGEDGLADAGIMMVKKNIIRVNNKFKDKAITLLSLIRNINKKRVMINTIKTSGILKKVIKI